MFKKQLRNFFSYSRSVTHIIVCLQLVLYPTWSFSAEADSASSASPDSPAENVRLKKHINNAIDFNAQVESIYERAFGVQESSEYYRSHPLDLYSLIGQEVQPYNTRSESVVERARRRGYSSTAVEQLTEEKEGETNTTKPEESQFLNKVRAKLEKPKPYLGRIAPDQLFIEVLDSDSRVQAILNSHGEEVRNRMSTEEKRNLYTGNSYITTDEAKYQFRLKYHDQVLHTFPNHIRWISAFEGYLVFMEASQVYERGRALISFIDLNYFQPALGKTQLPFFRIPATMDTEEKRGTLLKPEVLNIESVAASQDSQAVQRVLKVGPSGGKQFSITHAELELLARMQAIAYNVFVSFLSVERYESDIVPFIKSISEEMERSMEREIGRVPKGDHAESFRIMQNIISSGLDQRIGLGPVQDKEGIYTQWRAAEHQMGLHADELTEEQKEIYERLTNHLKEDKKLQEMIAGVGANHSRNRKILERLKGFYMYLAMPQPLGAPKILESLGAVANSLRQGEAVADRAREFMKAVTNKMGMEHRGVRLSAAFLVGAGSFAVPEIRDFYLGVYNVFGQWLANSWDMIARTTTMSVAFLDAEKLHAAYFSERMFQPLLTGLSALFTGILLSYGGTHILVNLVHFIKYARSQKAREHQEQVKGVFARWESHLQEDFHRNLAIMEMRKTGLPLEIHLQNGSVVKGLFQVGIRWADILENYSNKDYSIDWTINIHDAEKAAEKGPNSARVVASVKLTSFVNVPEVHSETQQKLDLVFRPSHQSEEAVSRTFTLVEGDLSELFKQVRRKTHLADSNNLSIELSGVKGIQDFAFGYNGQLIDADFSASDERRIRDNLQDVAMEEKNSRIRRVMRVVNTRFSKMNRIMAGMGNWLSETQMSRFIVHLGRFFSYANWSITFTVTAYIWNYYFLARSFVIAPRVGVKALWYQNYFDRIYNERHRATVLNGGRTSRLGAVRDVVRDYRLKKESGREYLSALKEFEQQILTVERTYLRASAEQAYHLVVSMFIEGQGEQQSLRPGQYNRRLGQVVQSGVSLTAGADKTAYGLKEDVSKAFYSLDLSRLNRRAKVFFELYQRILFKEAMREYAKERLGLSGQDLSDRQIRREVTQRLLDGNELGFSGREILGDARNRVRVLSQQLNLRDRVLHSVQRFYRDIMEKRSAKVNKKAEKFLNPNENFQMEAFEIVNQALKDPEAVARSTRAALSALVVDRPIELVFMFLMLVGVAGDITLLQIVHEEKFSEEAFFHLSRYSIWAGFMTSLVMSLLTDVWFKVREDARLAVSSGFDGIPRQEDVNRRFAGLRWYKQQTMAEENSLKANYKYSWHIVKNNFFAALVNIGLIYAITLGRFDIELFAAGYLAAYLIPFMALQIKLEQGYEKFNNFSLRKLIERGFDFNGKDKRLLSHPDIVQFKMQQSMRLRRKFNFLNALIYNNPVGNIVEIMSTINSSWGPRGLVRQFTLGGTPTEYWVRMVDLAQEKGFLSEGIAESCRKVFTKNRLDLE